MLHHPYQLLRCINSHLHIYFRVKLTKFAENSRESDLSDYIAILDEQIELLKVERLEKARCYQKIERQIKQMENEDEQEVLRLRYITGLKWEEVALKMNYSWKWIHKIHGRALQNFKI